MKSSASWRQIRFVSFQLITNRVAGPSCARQSGVAPTSRRAFGGSMFRPGAAFGGARPSSAIKSCDARSISFLIDGLPESTVRRMVKPVNAEASETKRPAELSLAGRCADFGAEA
jgi:hypothetical protein